MYFLFMPPGMKKPSIIQSDDKEPGITLAQEKGKLRLNLETV
jgi:hypothetical protein